MLNKLICLVWGHKYVMNNFSGEYAKERYTNPLTLIKSKIPIMIVSKAEFCHRCGKVFK